MASLASSAKKVTRKVNFGFEIRRTYNPEKPLLPDPDAERTKAISDASCTGPRTPSLGVASSDDDEVSKLPFPTTVEYSDLPAREPSIDKPNSFANYLGRCTSDSGSSGGESGPEESKSADTGGNAAPPVLIGSRRGSPMEDTPVSAINSSKHLIVDENTATLFKPCDALENDLTKSLHERIRTSTERGLKHPSKGRKQKPAQQKNSLDYTDASSLQAGAGRFLSEERMSSHVLEERTNTQKAATQEDRRMPSTGCAHGESGTHGEDRCISMARSDENVAPDWEDKREDNTNGLSEDDDGFPPLPVVINAPAPHLLSSDEENDALGGGHGHNISRMRRSVGEDTLYSPSEEELMVEAFDRSVTGDRDSTPCVRENTLVGSPLHDVRVSVLHKRAKTSSDSETCSPAKRRKSREFELEDALEPDVADLIKATKRSRLLRTKDSLALSNHMSYPSSRSSSSGSGSRKRRNNKRDSRKTESKPQLASEKSVASSFSPARRPTKRLSSISSLGNRNACAAEIADAEASASASPSFSASPSHGRMNMVDRTRKLREVGGGSFPVSSSDEEFDYRPQNVTSSQRLRRSKTDDSPSRLHTTPDINRLPDVIGEKSPKLITRKEKSELRRKEMLDMVDSSPGSGSDAGNREENAPLSHEEDRLCGSSDGIYDFQPPARNSSAVPMDLATTSSNDATPPGVVPGPCRRLSDTTSRISAPGYEGDRPVQRSSVSRLASSFSSDPLLSDTLSAGDQCCRHLVFEETTSQCNDLPRRIRGFSESQNDVVEPAASGDVTPSDMVIEESTLSNVHSSSGLPDSRSASMSNPCDGRQFVFEDSTPNADSIALDHSAMGNNIFTKQPPHSAVQSSSSYAPKTKTETVTPLEDLSPCSVIDCLEQQRPRQSNVRRSGVEFEIGSEIFAALNGNERGGIEGTKWSPENSVIDEDVNGSDNMMLETPPDKGTAMSRRPLHRRVKSPSLQTSMSPNTRPRSLLDRGGDDDNEEDTGVNLPGLLTPPARKSHKSICEATRERHPRDVPVAPPRHTPFALSEPPAPTTITQITRTSPAFARSDHYASSPTPARSSAAPAIAVSPPAPIPNTRSSIPPLPPLPPPMTTPSPSSRPVLSPTNNKLSERSDVSSEWGSPSPRVIHVRRGNDIFGIHHGIAPFAEYAISPSKVPSPRAPDSLTLLDADLAHPTIVRPLKENMWEEVLMEDKEAKVGGATQSEEKLMEIHAVISEAYRDMLALDHTDDSPTPFPSPRRHTKDVEPMFHRHEMHGRGWRVSRSPSIRPLETVCVDGSDSECPPALGGPHVAPGSALSANAPVAVASASAHSANMAAASSSVVPTTVAAATSNVVPTPVAATSSSAAPTTVTAASASAALTRIGPTSSSSSSTVPTNLALARPGATSDLHEFLAKCGIHIPPSETPQSFPPLDEIVRVSFPHGLTGTARTLFTAFEASRRKLVLQGFRWLPSPSVNYQSSIKYMDIYNSAVERNEETLLQKQVHVVWDNARIRACRKLREHSLHTQRSVDDAAKTFLEISTKQKEKMVKRIQLVKRIQARMTALRDERGILDTNMTEGLELTMQQTAAQHALEAEMAATVANKTAELAKIEQDIDDMRAVRRTRVEKNEHYEARLLETQRMCQRLEKRILGCKFRQTLVPWHKVDDHFEMNGHKLFQTIPRGRGIQAARWRFEPKVTRRLTKLAQRAFAEAFSYVQGHGGIELFSFAAHVKNIENLWFDIYDVIDDWMPSGIYVMFPDSPNELCARFQVARRAIISEDHYLIKETIDEIGAIFTIRWPVEMWAVRPARVQWFHRGTISVLVTPGDNEEALSGILQKKLQTMEYANWHMKSLLSEIGKTAQGFLNDLAKSLSVENPALFG